MSINNLIESIEKDKWLIIIKKMNTIRTGILHNQILHILLIAIVGFIAYSNTFSSPFTFDDKMYITENFSIKDLSNFLNISDKRYIAFLAFAVNYSLGGLNPFGYHIVNLIVHILNATLVYLLIVLTLRIQDAGYTIQDRENHESCIMNRASSSIAIFSALLFVSHPIQTQTVTYISQRFASLATMFYLLSIVMYAKWRLSGLMHDTRYIIHDKKNIMHRASWIMYLCSLLSAVLAMKTKEIAFTLPFIIILYEFSFFWRIQGSESKDLKKRFLYLLPFLFTLIIIPLSILGPEWGIYKPDTTPGEEIRQLHLEELSSQFRNVLFLPI